MLLLFIRSPSSLWFVSFSALAWSPTPTSWLRRCLPDAQLLTPVFLQLPNSPPPFLFYAFHMHHHGFFFSFSSPQNKGFCFFYLTLCFIYYYCVYLQVYVQVHMCHVACVRAENHLWSPFCSSTMGVPGIELTLSGLAASSFIC